MSNKFIDFFTGGESRKQRKEQIVKLLDKQDARTLDGKEFKAKDQNHLDRLRFEERRHFLKVVGVTTAGFLGFGGVLQVGKSVYEASQRPDKAPFTRLNLSTPSQLSLEEIMSAQNFWKQASLDALARFSDDPRVARLKDFMEKNAFFPLPMGPVVTQTLMVEGEPNPMENPQAFEVVFMPPQYANGMASSVLTEPGGRTVRVAETFRIKEWMGIMLAHELSHVWDQIVEHENSDNRDEYLAGEVKAHLFERDLLKLWAPAQFEQMVKEGGEFSKTHDTRSFKEVAEHYFPLQDLGDQEGALALASCLISTLFEVLQREGADEATLKSAYSRHTQRNR